jgi:hypothetical protein
LTIGITTAEEVPPIMAPTKTELRGLSLKKNLVIKDAITIVMTKFRTVSRVAEPIALLISLIFSPEPLSKRITIRVIVVKTLPIFPKKSFVIKPLTGPIIIPIRSKRRTFGIFVLLNSSLNACEEKIKSQELLW